MNKENPYIINEKVSIRPNKIVFYNEIVRKSKLSATLENETIEAKKTIKNAVVASEIKKPDSNKHNFELSKKASGRIKEKVTWLYHLAKNKTVTTSTGKTLYSFKMNFITLTLPSVQAHTTDILNKECLNQFFIECSKRFGMNNYVWRLEYQKNGNAHYHIATDVFIEYWQARAIWNRCLEKLGYVAEYAKGYEGMTLAKYIEKHPLNEKCDFKKAKERFTYGCASRWSNPNTVDVRMVTGAKNISFYIAKYITKKSDEKLNPIVSERENTNSNMRLWFCSRSLSKVDKISDYIACLSDELVECLSKVKNIKRMIYDYVEVYYFDIKNQVLDFRRTFRQILSNYAQSVGYYSSKKSYCSNAVVT